MFRTGKKVLISALTAGFLLGGTGILHVSAANAAPGQGSHQTRAGVQAGHSQSFFWPQIGVSARLQQNFQLSNQRQNQQQNQEQYQLQYQPQYNQQQQIQLPNQLQYNQPTQAGALNGFSSHNSGTDIISGVADILGVEEQTIIEALQDGQTLIEIAGDYNVSEEDLIEQLAELQSDAIDEALDEGTLSDEEANDLKEQLSDRLEQIVESMGTNTTSYSKDGSTGYSNYSLDLSLLTDAADILNIDEQTIIQGLKGGDTLAEIAEEYGVSADELLKELIDLQSDAIDDAVADGTLTDSQADNLKERLSDRLEQIIEGTL